MSTNEGFMECGVPLGYHDETGETEWCENNPVTGICSKHWDDYMIDQPAKISTLTKLLERYERANSGRCPECNYYEYNDPRSGTWVIMPDGNTKILKFEGHAPHCELAKAIGKV